MGRVSLSELVDSNSPESVFKEVRTTVLMMFPDFDFKPLNQAFEDTVRLFYGDYPGYRKCNTKYHDLKHTLDVFLAMARLIHGVYISRHTFSKEIANLGLISSLMHDTGYIQADDDDDGTGAKYTLVHVERSIKFMEGYFKENGFTEEDCEKCRCLIQSTSIDTKLKDIPFGSHEVEMMGKIHLAADLLGQMADRFYLEKLLFLFNEFIEGHVMGYDNELDLLCKTFGFYEAISERFRSELDNIDRNMQNHFRVRWNIDRDLYRIEVESNIEYLRYLLRNHKKDYRDKLKRGSIVKTLKD